jgi:hypothetical protein
MAIGHAHTQFQTTFRNQVQRGAGFALSQDHVAGRNAPFLQMAQQDINATGITQFARQLPETLSKFAIAKNHTVLLVRIGEPIPVVKKQDAEPLVFNSDAEVGLPLGAIGENI